MAFLDFLSERPGTEYAQGPNLQGEAGVALPNTKPTWGQLIGAASRMGSNTTQGPRPMGMTQSPFLPMGMKKKNAQGDMGDINDAMDVASVFTGGGTDVFKSLLSM